MTPLLWLLAIVAVPLALTRCAEILRARSK